MSKVEELILALIFERNKTSEISNRHSWNKGYLRLKKDAECLSLKL